MKTPAKKLTPKYFSAVGRRKRSIARVRLYLGKGTSLVSTKPLDEYFTGLRSNLWLKPFDDWTEIDWNTCGLSALWDIESGHVYWAEGAHSADDMPQVGKPIDEFIASAAKAE